MKPLDIHDEWLSLIEVSGPFLATPVLKRVFSTGLPAVEPQIRQYLRQAYDEWCEARDNGDPRFAELHRAWIHEVLARGLEYDESDSGELLLRGERIPAELRVALPEHVVTLAPDYVLVSGGKSQLLVQVYPAGTDLQAALKIDGWIANPAERMERLCRASDCRLGLVTDGERWMLVDAPVGAVSTFASWYARLWGQERSTLQAFLTLLGIRRFFGPEDETLPSMLDESLQHQEEVTDALGEQVRRAVEVLIQALDKEDRERSRILLQGVEPTELYEAGLTIMMRLVFLLSAEERGLLLMGEEAYETNYAISTLRMQLRQETEEVLERRNDAWSRLLATFRAVYGGIEHEALRLPALGGSLFDPDRFPFLEGRAKGSDWKIDPARPLPIDNRTVLLLLEAIQQYEGRTLSYRALDVEQIGYVYEGLLERTVARAEQVTVALSCGKNAKKTLYGLEELEVMHHQGDGVLIDALSGADAISRGAGAIRRDFERSVDAAQTSRLLTACAGVEELRDRTLPFLNLLRTDPWGYPLIYPAGAFIVITGSDRRETGTHYTPKSLTESIVVTTLEPIVYVGPAEGLPRERWSLKSVAELLDLKICDPAMGSGAFLVQVCRWLAERIVDAWALEETAGRRITSEGVAVDDLFALESLPVNPEDRLVIARRLVAERCLYGVDLNPLAVELAKLSIWLVTLAKGRPFGFLDHNFKCGDSLMGIRRLDQLTELSMTPAGKGQKQLFGQNIEKAVLEAIKLRTRLREMPIRDIHDVEAMARLNADAADRLKLPELVANAFVGEVFSIGAHGYEFDKKITSLSIQAADAINGSQSAIASIYDRGIALLSMDLPSGKGGRRPFHWPLEFPEIFQLGSGGFNALVGNPPFLGGKKISSALGRVYERALKSIFSAKGAGDLSCYFFRRSFDLAGDDSAIGMLATNSISEGDSPAIGLRPIINNGGTIYSAFSSFPWPGAASLYVAMVFIFKGRYAGIVKLDGAGVSKINSMLLNEIDSTPNKLKGKLCVCSAGRQLYGQGFMLNSVERDRIISADPASLTVIKPYFNAELLGKTPDYAPSAWAIDFGFMDEATARQYGAAFSRLEETVKAVREKITKQVHETRFWLYWDKRPGFFKEAANLRKILVCPRVSKHLAFHFIDPSWVATENLQLFATDSYAVFGLLQSSIHEIWARKYSSTLGEGLRYSTSDAFDTFSPPEQLLKIEEVGGRYYNFRVGLMSTLNIGATGVYNLFHKADVNEPSVVCFRELHVELDRACLSAFGWEDISLEHDFRPARYLSASGEIRFCISESARIEILRRLSELNEKRYEEEVAKGLHGRVKVSRVPPTRSSQNEPTSQQGLDFGETGVARAGKFYGIAAEVILGVLRTKSVWLAKGDILTGSSISDDQWSAAINDLIARGMIERQGERRGARYRAVITGSEK